MTIAFMFPGQGSQSVGMGKALADSSSAARDVFREVDDALGEALSRIMWEGPKEQLTLTENAQPALMCVSLAVMCVLEREKSFSLGRLVVFVAGHSLGEYSALAAAGAISLPDAARLLKTRGRAMQAAVPVGMGAMAALIGCDVATGRLIAAEAAQGDVCQVANDNDPAQVVISGAKAAVQRAAEICKAHGVKRAMMLDVSAPFHCALMAPAAEVMRGALAATKIVAPIVPVVANVTAGPISEPAEIRERLVEQVTGTVRWRESIAAMAADGVTEVCEIGSGKVLSGLARRIIPDLAAYPVGTMDEIDQLAARLSRA